MPEGPCLLHFPLPLFALPHVHQPCTRRVPRAAALRAGCFQERQAHRWVRRRIADLSSSYYVPAVGAAHRAFGIVRIDDALAHVRNIVSPSEIVAVPAALWTAIHDPPTPPPPPPAVDPRRSRRTRAQQRRTIPLSDVMNHLHSARSRLQDDDAARRVRNASPPPPPPQRNAWMMLCDGGNNECPICLEPIKAAAARLRCAHVFHEDCLKPWARRADTCPLCRCPFLEES